MSEFDDYTEDYDDQPEPSTQNPVRARMKQLEKDLREANRRLAESAELQKKVAFMEAGIPLESPMAKYFIKGYDGELTAEAIRSAAEEAQLIAPTPAVDDADRNAWRETNRIAAGGQVAPEPAGWAKRISDANSEAEIIAIFQEAQAQGIDLSEM